MRQRRREAGAATVAPSDSVRSPPQTSAQYIGAMRFPLSRLADCLPSICKVCGSWPSRPVCAACTQRFAAPRLRCVCCAAPMAVDMDRCGSCIARMESPAVGQCVVAVDYAYPWDRIVAQFKFRQQPGWAQPMAELMLRTPLARQLMSDCNAVVPVPLTPARLATRGYNQSWELVKALHQQALRTQAQVAPKLRQALLRTGETPDQHSLSREERMRNLRGVFLANPQALPGLQGAHVLLVDDVTTTGATLQAAGQALLAAGATRVSALVFARTPAV